MNRHAVAALSAIDRALGDVGTIATPPLSDWCWRCVHTRATAPGMMCQPCREYMSGESDDDPKSPRTLPPRTAGPPAARRPALHYWPRP